jgi:histidinol-phosphate aminotransferase
LGMAFASESIIEIYNKVKPPYNINQASQELAIKALEETGQVNEMIRSLVLMRENLAGNLSQLPIVEKVYPSDANFLLVRFSDPGGIYSHLLSKGIVVRDRSRVESCEGCLRITIGTEKENKELVKALEQFSS